jgi:serine/threonine protein kinase
MPLTIGFQLGSHEITALLGKGGMGEVYRARDLKLKREVAIKILPDEFARDSDRVSRFQREAEVLASLNHPNIAGIYDLREANGSQFLVLELVEGETLAERIARSPIALDECFHIARQVCEALEAAHEKGIVHRDLKPANVKITPDGKVKVLDFGLARALEKTPANPNYSNSPTLSIAATNAGVILGTAAYMSPEQAKGRSVDRRTDIFAFGCVLYELLAGRPAFNGEDVADILSRVLQRDPDWTLLPANLSPRIRELVQLCLEKDVRKRRSDAADVRIDIEHALGTESENAERPATSRTRERFWMCAAGALLIAFAALAPPALRYFREVPPPEMRLEISTPPTADAASIAISPNGQKIVFVATSEGLSKLWVRRLGSVSVRALSGTDGASFPFWSPDSQSVAFFGEGKLKRIEVDSGTVQILTDALSGRGGSWNRDGTIIFTPDTNRSPVLRIPATGGTPSAVTRLEATKETNHRFPQFLPDGRHFLYYVQGSPESHGIYAGDLDGSPARRLLDVDSAPVYESSGHLFFVRQGTLFAQEFDASRLELKGNRFSVAERIATVNTAQGSFAVSASSLGPIIYRTALAGGVRQFVWFDRSGKEVGKAGDPTSAVGLSISPDSRRVALHQQTNNNYDVWLLDLGRNVLSKFTFNAAVDGAPVWSPDSRTIVFKSNRNGVYDLYTKPATGQGSEDLLLAGGPDKQPLAWSPDGQFLLYQNADPKTGLDIFGLQMSGANGSPTGRSHQETDGDRKPFPVVRTNFDEDGAQFSPDGKWIAYQSNESGRYEIYIQAFPGPGDHTQVSTNGGAQVRWSRDEKELFYIALDGRLMAVPIHSASNSQAVEAGSPVPLFITHVGGALTYPNNQQYDVSPDGQRFLMNTIIEEAPSPITVILNWKAQALK